jgi:prepilin-type processing-associated H-X9-DG protein/prepilin-type N-terminal cleavage/methylation domain-containing protein
MRRAAASRRSGFTLVELLVIVAIIAILIGILLPVLVAGRRSARSTACLANLQQLSHLFQLYLNDNRDRSIGSWEGHPDLYWWEALSPYNARVAASLRCPEAPDSIDGTRYTQDGVEHPYVKGSVDHAWHVASYNAAEPQWTIRGDWRGSYGLNSAVYRTATAEQQIKFPPRQAGRMPLIADCTQFTSKIGNPKNGPKTLEEFKLGKGDASDFCIDRHRGAVNVVFLDGHAQHVSLPDLWKLKWDDLWP